MRDRIRTTIGRFVASVLACALLSACGGCGGSDTAAAPVKIGTPRAVTLNASLSSPWGLAFLPGGRMLVTQKGGTMVVLAADGASVQATLGGLPAVVSDGQGGLMDVALDPDFATDPWVYWTYSEPGTGAEAGLSGTAVARGRLVGDALQDVAVIYRQVPKVSGAGHFGSRLAFRGDKTLFVTLGERQKGSPAQDLATTLGKVVRIRRDGTIPSDNPGITGARPEIWSYGHRNPQGAAIRPGTDELWVTEHGPQGGDDLNRIVPGGNHGWPLVSYGCNYGDPVGDACRIGGGTHAPAYVEPVSYWVPTSIAPAGLLFYTGTRFPAWQSSAFLGALAGTALWRVELRGNGALAGRAPGERGGGAGAAPRRPGRANPRRGAGTGRLPLPAHRWRKAHPAQGLTAVRDPAGRPRHPGDTTRRSRLGSECGRGFLATKWWTPFFDPRFTVYIASSPAPINSSTVSGAEGKVVAPRLTVTAKPAFARSLVMATWTRAVAARQPSSSVPGISAANSSPPTRATTSLSRRDSFMAWPTIHRTSSPRACPCRSLTALKSSTSR